MDFGLQTPDSRLMYRIGIGHDTHRLAEGRPLVLGGVLIASEVGAEGHSDADALAHAAADAILGALCEGDLGVHFPDRDPQWKDADSLDLLARVMWLAGERGWSPLAGLEARVEVRHRYSPPCSDGGRVARSGDAVAQHPDRRRRHL